MSEEVFTVWAGACSHIHTDLERAGRESLADAIRQSEENSSTDGPSIDWDVFLHLGDLSGSQLPPDDDEGRELVRQLSALQSHRREQMYNILGNHDASGPDEPTQWWFKKWVDPTGKNTEHSRVNPADRPFDVRGNWERYSFQVGNILFLMMGDRNDGGPPSGRGVDDEAGGYPAGKVTTETFEWWRRKVEENQDKILVTCHHHMLRDTTIGSGRWEGILGDFHGYMEDGAPEGAGYLYFVGDVPDANRFESYLTNNPGAIDIWLGGHTHAAPGQAFAGKSHVERKWGVNFVNVGALTKYHAGGRGGVPASRVIEFTTDGRHSSVAKMRCYLHSSDEEPVGWRERDSNMLPLRHSFSGVENK